jgi:hypothetical protein
MGELMGQRIWVTGMVFSVLLALGGCQTMQSGPDASAMAGLERGEPGWIVNGEPISFEGNAWFPTDEVERFLESEVFRLGVYREVPFFVDRTDVRPFERIYTRFAPGRYRAFEQKP